MYQPPRSLLLQAPVPEWPAAFTNGELLELARTWRGLALECNADKASIEAGVNKAAAAVALTGEGAAEAAGSTPAPAKPWWKLW